MKLFILPIALSLVSCNAAITNSRYNGTVVYWDDMHNASFDSVRTVVSVPSDTSWLQMIIQFRKGRYVIRGIEYGKIEEDNRTDTLDFYRVPVDHSLDKWKLRGSNLPYIDMTFSKDSLYLSLGSGYTADAYRLKREPTQ